MRRVKWMSAFGLCAAVALLGCKSDEPKPTGENTDSPAGTENGGESSNPNGNDSNMVAAKETRRFHFDYHTTVGQIPANSQTVRVWVPLPQTDENQTIENLTVTTAPDLPVKTTTEKKFGNMFAYVEATAEANNVPAELSIHLAFDVTRRETTMQSVAPSMPANPEVLLAGDSLAPITEEVKARTTQATAGHADATAKARAIYDRVLADMAYDKSGTGWGRGDIAHACEVGKGNCSDFHTLFIAMSRAAQIPAFFEIGFPLPADKTEGEIGGYHCWAWYQGDDGKWHPVDASEADKAPEKADYFFGTICCNRVAFTRGRDLLLDPAPASGAQNFLVYPLVEIDGQVAAQTITKKFTFKNIMAGNAAGNN